MSSKSLHKEHFLSSYSIYEEVTAGWKDLLMKNPDRVLLAQATPTVRSQVSSLVSRDVPESRGPNN